MNSGKYVSKTHSCVHLDGFSMVKVCVPDSQYSIIAPKELLKLSSPYLEEALREDTSGSIVLEEISLQGLTLMIDYIQTSELILTDENIEAIMEASRLLRMTEIETTAEHFLEAILSVGNCCKVWSMAEKFSLHSLARDAFRLASNNFDEITNSTGFLELSEDLLIRLISYDWLKTESEKNVLTAAVEWILHNQKSGNIDVAAIMSHIRFPLFSASYLLKNMFLEPLIRNNSKCRHMVKEAIQWHAMDMDKRKHSGRAKPRMPNQILLIGGYPDYQKVLAYDFQTEQWGTKQSSLPENREFCAVAKSGSEQVYVLGGLSKKYQNDGRTSVLRCESGANRWIYDTHMLAKRFHLSAGAIDNHIYAIGGYNARNRWLSTVEKFDTSTSKWSFCAGMNHSRADAAVAVYNNTLYVFGGTDGTFALYSSEKYDPNTDQWTLISPMSQCRFNAGAAVLNGLIYVVGGYNEWDQQLCSVEVYNPEKDIWSDASDMLLERRAPAVVGINGLLYVIGGEGRDRQDLDSVEILDPKSDEWNTSEKLKLPHGRSFVNAVSVRKFAD